MGQSLTTSTCLGIDVVQEGDCGLEDPGRASDTEIWGRVSV